MNARSLVAIFGGLILAALAVADDSTGKRPYEMVWAGRNEDDHPALADFENRDGWTVQCVAATAQFTRSRQQQLWGEFVGKLTYRGTGASPVVTVRPPQPIALVPNADCFNFWIYGNNWAWMPDPTTPPVDVTLLLKTRNGQPLRIPMGRVFWEEWWVMHRKLTPEQQAMLKDGGVLEGIEIAGGRNTQDRTLFFDNLSMYREELKPLAFAPRAQRNLTPLPGQILGANTGPGKLPFPTRETTILPDNLTAKHQVDLEDADQAYTFRYHGDDGELVYRYKPETGTLSDLSVEWVGRGKQFRPLVEGGVVLTRESGHSPADKWKLLSCRRAGNEVVSTWQARCGQHVAEVTYVLRLWQKSLVIDVLSSGGHVGEVRFGRAVECENPRLVTLPYLVCDQQRPAVLVAGPADKPLFLMGLVDHCRSNATALFAQNEIAPGGVTYNGGSRYEPKTDGRRNDCCERLFLTVSPRFEEVLPNIPNPKSPWMHVAGERLWIAHGASNRDQDYALWKNVARYGMTKVVITDHETGWRDGGESFTLRTRAAPGKGGDKGQAEYARKIRALGFRYGIYNNYTDFAPVNEHWSEDRVTRLSDGQFQTAWPRCYNLKPSRAVELEAQLAPIIQRKFHLDTAYCDVHTAISPWTYCDRDARVPGAGAFTSTLFAYGEIMLHQKKTWDGPVYSEGNNHWYYCGLTDGNYGQDQAARLPENPWLVDFDLRKMHPLCCNFGMGNPGMFYGERRGLGQSPEEREASLDRFLAATLAFGHTGFLVLEGMPFTVRSYFNVQQVHAAYAQEKAVDIRYADGQGHLLDTSAAVATGAYRRSQIRTTYTNGLAVTVNGHPKETWKTPDGELPPNGWTVADPSGKLVAWSKQFDGHRADYVDSPAYLYADGRGKLTRFPKATCDRQMIAHKQPDGTLEIIPVGECKVFGVSLDGKTATATALDIEGKTIGPAETRLSRGVVFITPIAKAFSYVLKPGAIAASRLESERSKAIPGEKVVLEGRTRQECQAPKDASVGSAWWHSTDGAWIDFTIVPLVDASLEIAPKQRPRSESVVSIVLRLTPHVPVATSAKVTLLDKSEQVSLAPEKDQETRVDVAVSKEEVRPIPLRVVSGDMRYERNWWLKVEKLAAAVAAVPEQFVGGQCLRGAKERALGDNTGAHAHWTETRCGDVERRCLFMHPPYMTGPGYTFARFEGIDLPSDVPAALRLLIGKADGSDPGDGILFRVAVIDSEGKETIVAEKQWIEHAWTPLEADLARWAGQRVQLKLIADVGRADNSSGDWACWSDLRIESRQPIPVASIHDRPVELQHAQGPYPVEKLSIAELRKAKRAVLHFQGMGLESAGQYVSHGSLNNVPLGPLPGAGGDEVKGVWADASLPLPPRAIETLGLRNRFALDNPGMDCFKIRRFWIELELADGRRCSSDIATAAFTQPPGWKYAEGTGVPFGQRIEATIRFGE